LNIQHDSGRPQRAAHRRFIASGDVSGAVADLGVFVPLVAALILVNGVQPAALLIMAGLLSISSGLWFGVPFPVQPLKALTALAVVQRLDPDVIHAAGLLIGLILLLLGVTGLADRAAALFTKPVIRSLQLAVGVLLILSAWRLAANPPPLFAATPGTVATVLLASATAGLTALAVWRRWFAAAVVVLAAGFLAAWIATPPMLGPPLLVVPSFAVPSVSLWGSAFVLLVIPQLPLTYGNAVVGMADLAREHFPDATRVRAGAVALSCGLGNVASAVLGGMPMCHGSSGFSAHVRLGACTPAMNVLLGGTFVTLGLLFSRHVLTLFGLLPVWGLAGFLAYAGIRHAMMVTDLRGRVLVWAVVAASAGIITGNLAWTTLLALAGSWVPWLRVRLGTNVRANAG